VQNILVLRYANGIFEPIWNRRYVDHVQMTVAEDAGVGKRGAYYDKAGALRDIVQNHMFQVLTLVAMEPPISFGGEDVRDEKVRVLHAVPPLTPDDVKRHVVRAQYDGYTKEANVSPDSRTETFVAMRLFIDNWRWAGIPFYLRTGKRLAKRVTEVSIQLKQPPYNLFKFQNEDDSEPNVIALEIQPNEGISVKFEAKLPGLSFNIEPVHMDFRYGSAFGASVPEAYERLLLDALLGDQSLFPRADWVETAWGIIDPILQGWKQFKAPLYHYVPGSWGPVEAMDFIARDGRQWRRL
jgi:glucose-6-phosphate 1-dehydrogenase